MRLIRRPRWTIREDQATPEAVFWNRRRLLAAGAGVAAIGAGVGAGVGLLGRGGGDAAIQAAAAAPPPSDAGGSIWARPTTPIDPAPPRNPAYADAGRPVTEEETNATYNNFYEFGSHKAIAAAAEALQTAGWMVTIDGMVERPTTIDIDGIVGRLGPEERVYRHRCVEAWSMVVPWVGVPLSKLLALAGPQAGAKYVRFETFQDPEIARGQRQHWYPWPYTEGLTIEEAGNELAFMVVGAYGKVLHKPFGAPIRLHLPWKYGFKSIKSIRRITLTDQRPVSFWEELQASEYGFWANVNPAVSHPRWSQASERVLGTDERIPTQIYNGYGAEVASLYAGLDGEGDRLWR